MSDSFSQPLHRLLEEVYIEEVVRDCVALVRDEVSKKRGLSAVVIKGGLKVIDKVRPNIMADLFKSLLPTFVEQITPLYERFMAGDESTQTTFSSFLAEHSVEVASTLLSVTDARAERSKLMALVKVYQKLRPLAQDQIVSALPALGRLLAKHGVS